MEPQNIGTCPSPDQWRALNWADFKKRALDGINSFRGSSLAIEGPAACSELAEKTREITHKIRLIQQKAQEKRIEEANELFFQLRDNITLHNRVNKLLWVFTSERRPLPESMEFVPTINNHYAYIFNGSRYEVATPIEFADDDPRREGMTCWELLLQIRGRCEKIQHIYEERHTIAKIKGDYEILKARLAEAQNQENQLALQSQIQGEAVRGIRDELQECNAESDTTLIQKLQDAEREENRLLRELKAAKEGLSSLKIAYESSLTKYQAHAEMEIKENDHKFLEIEKRYKAGIAMLQEENESLQSRITVLYKRNDELEERLKKQAKEFERKMSPPPSPINMSETTIPKNELVEKELKALRDQNAFLKKEWNTLMDHYEVETGGVYKKNELLTQLKNELDEKSVRCEQIAKLTKKTKQILSSSMDPNFRANILDQFFRHMNELT